MGAAVSVLTGTGTHPDCCAPGSGGAGGRGPARGRGHCSGQGCSLQTILFPETLVIARLTFAFKALMPFTVPWDGFQGDGVDFPGSSSSLVGREDLMPVPFLLQPRAGALTDLRVCLCSDGQLWPSHLPVSYVY